MEFKLTSIILAIFMTCGCLCEDKYLINLIPVDELRAKLVSSESALWKNLQDASWNEINAAIGIDIEIAKKYVEFDDQMKRTLNNNTNGFTVNGLDNAWLWIKVSKDLMTVENIYTNFISFCRRQVDPLNVPSSVHEWIDFADSIITDPNTSVLKATNRIDEVVLHMALYQNILKDANPDLCNLQQSPHQLLYTMYNRISLTEIKGYAMMQFSWMLLKLYGKGNFTQEAQLMRQRFEERTALMVTAVKSAMSKTKRDMYRCDPELHEEGETYVQITRFLQGYIENEVDMNTDGTCRENCAFYTLAKNQGCFKDQYCARQAPCTGRILNCQYVDSDMWICPATRESGRRYEWIEYENGRTLGKPGSCMRGTSKVDSWWRWLFWHCSYCMCLCDQPDELSDRFFSLRETVSNVKQNKVITGIRFKKVNRVIHLQINEGKLLPRGNIDQTSLKWQPLDAFDPEDSSLIDGIDYHSLTYEKRAIDLDELEGIEGHVLTGVRFKMLGSNLHLEIRVTPFNYTIGKLFDEKHQWISNDNTGASLNPRKQLTLEKPDLPTRSIGTKYRIDSTHDQYIDFTHTDMDADAAQTTVPFIDTQIVMPASGVPLTGAGIYHRGERGSGGFIAPKVFTYDYTPHMKSIIAKEGYEIEEKVRFVPKDDMILN